MSSQSSQPVLTATSLQGHTWRTLHSPYLVVGGGGGGALPTTALCLISPSPLCSQKHTGTSPEQKLGGAMHFPEVQVISEMAVVAQEEKREISC